MACSGSSTPSLDLNGFGARYKLADNEVSGWTPSAAADGFATYTPDTLTQAIDGAADPYIANGMKYTLIQKLTGPDPKTATLRAMDMTSEEKAKSMVSLSQSVEAASTTIPGYDASVAIASEALTGITIYAYLKALYLEVILDGYGTDHEPARQDGAKFLQAEAAKAPLTE